MEHRVSNAQIHSLLDILSENPSLVRGVGLGPRSKEAIDRKWQEIADILNAHGSGSSKSAQRWKRYWSDLKHKVKSRAAQRLDAASTGGGPSMQEDLNDIDRKVLAIIGEAAVYGDTQHAVPFSDIQASSSGQQLPHILEEVIIETASYQDSSTDEVLRYGGISTIPPAQSPEPTPSTSRGGEPQAEMTTGSETPTVCSRGKKRLRSSPLRTHKLRNQQNVNKEWVIELERRKVDAEEKMAEAAITIANAAAVMADACKMQAEASLQQSNNIKKLCQMLESTKK